jgi:hypothetical protein
MLMCSKISYAQDEEPRYSRFQWHKYYWKVYRNDKFNVYFPADAADSIYRYIAEETPEAIERIKKATLKEVPKDLNIIIYPSIEQLYETNIGAFEPAQLTLPTFTTKGTRIVLAYNGSYAEIKRQLYEGLARSLWESQLKEGGTEDQLKGSSTTTKTKSKAKDDGIPFWFKEGAIRYFAHGWTIDAEDKLRNSLEENNFTSWSQVLAYEPRLGGQAFCYFINQKYYPKAIAQTLFQLKKKKSLQRAIRLITKHNLDSLYTQCFNYYSQRFPKKIPEPTHTNKETIGIPHQQGIVLNVQLSPNKQFIAYVTLAKGRRAIYIYDLQTKKTKKVASYLLPPWIDDHSADQYPLIQWGKDDKALYVVKPKKGMMEVKKYTSDGQWMETTTLDGVDGLTSFQQLSDNTFLITAYKMGQSDIVSYDNKKERFTPYTDDEYDDSEPKLTGNKDGIVFVANRPKELQERKTYLIGVGYKKDTLWQGIYKISGKQLTTIEIDTTSYIKWDKPVLLKNNSMLATTTRYGSERNVTVNYLSGSITMLGNYHPFQYLPQSDEISFYKAGDDSIYTTQQPVQDWIRTNTAEKADTSSPWLKDYKAMLAMQAKEDALLKKGKDTTHYMMDDIFKPGDDKKDAKKEKQDKKKKGSSKSDNAEKVSPYVLQLQSAYFTAQVNNDYFMNRYQPFLNYQGQFKSPEITGMTKGGFTDLFENHHFTIAYALPAATDGSTFFISYENTEKKVDWGIKYLRKVETLQPDPSRNWIAPNGQQYPNNAKDKTHYYELFFKDPITYDCYVKAQTAIRQDRSVFVATDKYSLDFDPIISLWSITTLSFDLNKLHKTLPYLYKGFKMSAHYDFFKGFDQQGPVVHAIAVNLRYDQPLYKYITAVTQMHAGWSDGSQKILYNLGGEDNNVTPRVDTTVHFPQNAPYAFQTLVAPFRGYLQNSLYGNQYLLMNEDIYFPIFQTLIPLQTPLPSINNFQLGLLSDVATAQETWNNNPNNAHVMWSYGVSARTVLAGYPLRLDMAWPGTFRKAAVFYFSLNLQ